MKLLITDWSRLYWLNFVILGFKPSNDEIIVLDNLICREFGKSGKRKTQNNFVKGDICDETVVDQTMSSVNTVVHLRQVHVDRSIWGLMNLFGQTCWAASTKSSLQASNKDSTTSPPTVFGQIALESKKNGRKVALTTHEVRIRHLKPLATIWCELITILIICR